MITNHDPGAVTDFDALLEIAFNEFDDHDPGAVSDFDALLETASE
jgi:hypothetical protein